MFGQDALMQWVIANGYWALFWGMVIEGPIITILGGFLTSLGYFNIYYVYLIIVLADLLEDLLAYSIGYFGRKRALLKIFSWLQIPEQKLLDIEKFFKSHGGKSVFVSKFVAGAGSWTLISAGIAKMNLWKFFKNSFIAAIIKSALYIGIGFFFGGLYKVIARFLNTAGTIVTLLIIAAVVLWLMKSSFRLKRNKKEHEMTKHIKENKKKEVKTSRRRK